MRSVAPPSPKRADEIPETAPMVIILKVVGNLGATSFWVSGVLPKTVQTPMIKMTIAKPWRKNASLN